jgi:hypothetical protein
MADLGGSVSLTLGLQHSNNNAGHVPPELHGLLYGGNPGLNGTDDRQRFTSLSSQRRRHARGWGWRRRTWSLGLAVGEEVE